MARGRTTDAQPSARVVQTPRLRQVIKAVGARTPTRATMVASWDQSPVQLWLFVRRDHAFCVIAFLMASVVALS